MRIKAPLLFLFTAGLLPVLLGSCGGPPSGVHESLTDRFDDYPALRNRARLDFSPGDFFAAAGTGWALPGGRPDNPYWIVAAEAAEIRVLLDPASDSSMRLLCRAGRETDMSVRLNGRFLTRKVLRPGRNRISIPLTGADRVSGPNLFSFHFSPEPRIRGREERITFRRLDFLPRAGKVDPEIRVDSRKNMVRLRGGIQSHFLVRTGKRPRFRMEFRSAAEAGTPARLNLRFEDFQGHLRERNVEIGGTAWESLSVDLKNLAERTVKITFRHDAGPDGVSELRAPRLDSPAPPAARPRILLIGLDGATWDVMNPLLAEGRLPHIARLMRSGVSAPLRTVRPWFSPVVWTSIMTGKTMDKHGITGFLQQRRLRDTQLPNSRLNRKCLALWNILNRAGFTVGLIGPWVSWPAEPVDGYILTDRIDFRNLAATSSPPELKGLFFNRLQAEAEQSPPPAYGELIAPLGSVPAPRSPTAANLREAGLYYRQDLWKSRAGLALDRIFHPDFTFLYLRGPDVSGHFFWKYHEPDTTVPDTEIDSWGGMLRQNYIFQDAVIGDYMERFGSRAWVMIVSDHGMGRKSYTPEMGFERVDKLWEHMGLSRAIAESMPTAHGLRLRLSPGFDPGKIRRRLEELRAGAGRKPFLILQDGPSGSTLELALSPGIAVDDDLPLFDGERRLGPLDTYSSSREISGDHTMDGILILGGPNLRTGTRLHKASVLDVAPTLMHILGIPMGEDMDGRVLEEAFSPAFMKTHPVRRVVTHETGKMENSGPRIEAGDPSPDEELLRRLKSLGYIK